MLVSIVTVFDNWEKQFNKRGKGRFKLPVSEVLAHRGGGGCDGLEQLIEEWEARSRKPQVCGNELRPLLYPAPPPTDGSTHICAVFIPS